MPGGTGGFTSTTRPKASTTKTASVMLSTTALLARGARSTSLSRNRPHTSTPPVMVNANGVRSMRANQPTSKLWRRFAAHGKMDAATSSRAIRR